MPPPAFPTGKFDVILADPPWSYYGSPTKMAAAGKHYRLMPDAEIAALPVGDLAMDRSVLFVWATCPKLDTAIGVLEAWGFCFRGVAFAWVKTTKQGVPIGARGVRPSITKPTVELLLAASKTRRGRPMPIADESVAQVILAPPAGHSEKPPEAQRRIERLYPAASKIELFARRFFPGWHSWGDQLPANTLTTESFV